MKPLYKILIIAGVIIIAGGAVYLAWQKLTAPAAVPAAEPGTPLPTGTGNAAPGWVAGGNGEENGSLKTPIAALTLKKISESPAFDLWVAEGTGEIYYLTPDGKVMDVKEGPDLEISTQTLTALNRVVAAPGGGRVLAAFGDPRTPQWAYFDIIDRSWHPLPPETMEATWAGRSDQIVALVRNGKETNLLSLNLAQNPPTTKVILRNLALQDVTLWFQPPEELLFLERPSATYAARVWRLDLKTLNWNLVLAPERGSVVASTRGGELFIKSTLEQSFLLSRDFERSSEVPSFSTLPGKCEVFQNSLYCFVPSGPLPTSIRFPDDYYQNKIYTVDTLVVVPFSSSTLTVGAAASPWGSTADAPIDAKNPVYAGGNLYFINRYDNYVYELKL